MTNSKLLIMKNFFRASLLGVLFVGMSGFASHSLVVQNTQGVEILRPYCEDEAMFAYYAVRGVSPYILQNALNEVFSTVY
jgi:hypothetical protein